MYKINKCITLTRTVPRGCLVRFIGCGDKCPPRYECKRPQVSETEAELEEIKQMDIPPMFQKHCPKDYRPYKRLFYFVCLPTILCFYINIAFFAEQDLKRPKFVDFSYMRIRRKEFPWDPVRSLFHNPERNALPTGYETEVPEENEYDPFEGK